MGHSLVQVEQGSHAADRGAGSFHRGRAVFRYVSLRTMPPTAGRLCRPRPASGRPDACPTPHPSRPGHGSPTPDPQPDRRAFTATLLALGATPWAGARPVGRIRRPTRRRPRAVLPGHPARDQDADLLRNGERPTVAATRSGSRARSPISTADRCAPAGRDLAVRRRWPLPPPGDRGRADPAFQGFGRVLTDADGRYRFRTMRPAPYTGRTPHIHVKLRLGTRTLLTTQVYVRGDPGNERDMLWRGLRDPPTARPHARLRAFARRPAGLVPRSRSNRGPPTAVPSTLQRNDSRVPASARRNAALRQSAASPRPPTARGDLS